MLFCCGGGGGTIPYSRYQVLLNSDLCIGLLRLRVFWGTYDFPPGLGAICGCIVCCDFCYWWIMFDFRVWHQIDASSRSSLLLFQVLPLRLVLWMLFFDSTLRSLATSVVLMLGFASTLNLLVGYPGGSKANLFIIQGLYRDYTTPKG